MAEMAGFHTGKYDSKSPSLVWKAIYNQENKTQSLFREATGDVENFALLHLKSLNLFRLIGSMINFSFVCISDEFLILLLPMFLIFFTMSHAERSVGYELASKTHQIFSFIFKW